MFEFTQSELHARYKIGLGLPTNLVEQVLGITWNLIVLLTGIILIVSAPELPNIGKGFRFGFLPLIYGIYGLRLAYMYWRVSDSVPEIISSWCNPLI